jgi:predicted phage-related endonuclease
MAITPEQLEARRRYLGSSDIAPICGLCAYRSPLNVYQSKVHGVDKPAGRKAYLGTLLEPIIARLAAERIEEKTGAPVKLSGARMVVHENGIFCANLDSECIETEEPFVVECKASFGAKPHQPHPHRELAPCGQEVLVSWGRSGADPQSNIPLSVYVQVQWQLLLTGYSLGYVACWRGHMDEPIGLWTVNRDQQTIDVISEKAMEFWQACVVPKIPPAVLGKDQEVVNAA